jgi:hypothetical protein
VGVVLLTTACASGDTEADPSASPTVSVSGSPSKIAVTEEDAVSATVDRYWAIEIGSQNRRLTDPTMFDGVAEGPHIERKLKTLQDYQEYGIRRVGRPSLGDPGRRRRRAERSRDHVCQ